MMKGKSKGSTNKCVVIRELPDKNAPGGKMYHAEGKCVSEGLKEGKIKANDTWSTSKEDLLTTLLRIFS